jgi:biopolymer transport protein ExbD
MSRRRHIRREPAQLNLTSMLDVILQLIIFFLLVTNFAAQTLPPLEPPNLTESAAQTPFQPERVTVNLLPDAARSGLADEVRVNMRAIPPGDLSALTALLEAEKEKNPEVEIDLRADRSIHYRHVQPIMNAVTAAGISRINLVAYTDDDRPVAAP